MSDVIGVWVGAILTLLVFSYLLGDTFLFRVAQAIFVGVAVGYAGTVAFYYVLGPRLFDPLINDPVGNSVYLIPLILGLMLFAKLRPAWTAIGNIPIAFLFGVGAALAIGGALSGTLVPQLGATAVSLVPAQGSGIDNLLLAIGAIGALLSFQFVKFSTDRPLPRLLNTVSRAWGTLGRWFILVAFGAIFADTAVSRISILIDRIYYLLHDWLHFV
jgi:hypothetical protein